MAINALKKLTIKDIIKGKPEKQSVKVNVVAEDGSVEEKTINVAIACDLAVFYGRARNHRTGNTAFGPFTEYVGTFEARRMKDGEIFQSTRMIPPPIADDLVGEAYANAKRLNPDDEVDVAFIVGVEPDTKGTEGYKFTCKPVKMGGAVTDPLAELRSSLATSFAASLPADVMLKLGFAAPGEGALQITSDGEVIEGQSKVKKDKPPVEG